MSKASAVHSHGRPYFSFFGTPDAVASELPETGATGIDIDFSIFRIPKQLATPDECHPLFSLGDYFSAPPGQSVLSIGVSPSGRLIGKSAAGGTVMSDGGFISPDGRKRSAHLAYAPGVGMFLSVDGVLGSFSGGAPGPPALPDRYARPILLNDVMATSNFEASVARVMLSFYSAAYNDIPTITWEIAERYGNTLAAKLGVDNGAVNGGFWVGAGTNERRWDMMANWLDPFLYAKPWGDVPFGDASIAFEWEVTTAYTKRIMPTTEYRKALAHS